MESATVLTPPFHRLKRYSAFCQNPIFLKDQIMKININTISMYGEKFYQLHAAQRQLLRLLNNLENGSFRNRVSLQYKKTIDSVILSLFMRSNGKCNNSHAT